MRTEVMDRQDVGMVKSRGGLRLLLKARQTVGITRKLGGQDFDCHVAVEPCVACTVDFAHAASTRRRDDLVGTQLSTSFESHWRVIIA